MTWLLESAFINAFLASILAIVAVSVSRWGRRPALGHALWLLVLVKLITPPLIELPIHVTVSDHSDSPFTQGLQAIARPAPAAAPAPQVILETTGIDSAPLAPTQAIVASSIVADPPAQIPVRIRGVILLYALWGLGCLAFAVVIVRRIRRFAQAVRQSDLAPHGLQARAATLAQEMGLCGSPPVRLMEAHVSPMLWGCGSYSSIILPYQLLDELTETEVDALLAHEIAHFRRRDHWVRILELVVATLFWWHPVVWLARKEIERCEEECCDAWVVTRFPKHARSYAEAILSTIEFISERRTVLPPVASGMADVPEIERRLRQIMLDPVPRTVSRAARVWLVVSAVVLPLHPVLTAVPARTVMASLAANPFRTERIPAADPAVSPSPTNIGELDLDPIPELLNSPIYQTVPAQSEYASAQSSDGRFRLTAELGRHVTLQDTLTARNADLSAHQITSVAFLGDGSRFLAGAQDGSVRIWTAEDATPATYLGAHDAAVKSLDVSPDGRQAVTGAADGSVWLWQIASETFTAIPLDVVGGVNCVRFSPDGRAIAVSAGSWHERGAPVIVVYDLLNAGRAQTMRAQQPVAAIQFDATDHLIAFGWDGRAVRWDLSTGTAIGAGAVAREAVALASFSSRNRVAVGDLTSPVAAATNPDGALLLEDLLP